VTTTVETRVLDLLTKWDGVGVVVRHDRPTGTWIFVAIHDATFGPATGGCRIKQYPTAADGLLDAMRLAEGMTYKWGSIGLPHGGGKSVLAIQRPMVGDERVGLFKRFGHLLASLQGAYSTGQDLGTTAEDMAIIASACDQVMGAPKDGSLPTDPGPFTALGVFEGIRAAVHHADGRDDLDGITVLVQGIGGVGGPLCRLLAEAGAGLLMADMDSGRCELLASELDGSVVPPDAIDETQCDVYAPCATGATLNAESIPALACRIVAGSANNQLHSPEDAQRLVDRGILYAPDYVINAGGAMTFGLINQGVTDRAELERRVRSLGDTLGEIFTEADSNSITPTDAATRRVDRLLATARHEQGLGREFTR